MKRWTFYLIEVRKPEKCGQSELLEVENVT